ncbi:MAG: hypothetical protein ACI85Q_001303 [Salibacteraceae bacterium]|jgi:uncharacterized protein YbjT (DUF2867 family)
MKKVIVTGATGMVGKAVLIECLKSSEIDHVLSISRRTCGLKHDKLKELIHPDFSDFSNVISQLKGFDACFASMGVSSAGMNENDFTRFTYQFTMALAKELVQLNPQMVYTYVSGVGTDGTEKGKTMWARVKGKTENDLMKLGFSRVYAFRPGMIVPKNGVTPSSKLYRVLIKSLGWVFPIMSALFPSSIVDSDQLGRAMIKLLKVKYASNIIYSKDIIELSK